MRNLIFPSLLVASSVLAVITIVEAMYGTEFVLQHFYGSLWFKAMWAVMVCLSLPVVWKRKMWRNRQSMVFHSSFVIILLGALVTSVTGEKSTLHLREGRSVVVGEGTADEFSLSLEKFAIEYYPGTQAPMDYQSAVVIRDSGSDDGKMIAGQSGIAEKSDTAVISMNNILKHNGYRLYQSSFDPDMKGTVLTVNHDPYGVAITYAGYLLLLVGSILVMLNPKGRFRRLIRNPLLKGAFAVAMMLTFGCGYCFAESSTPRAVTVEEAENLKSKQVIYNDRIVPLNTLALDFCQKVTGKRSFGGLTPEQLLASIMLYPEDWQHVPLIKVEGESLAESLGIKGKYAPLTAFFGAAGNYKLQPLYIENKGTDSSLEKAIMKMDERCALVVMLTKGELVRPVPSGVTPLSNAAVEAELIYNALPWIRIAFILAITLACVALVLQFGVRKTWIHALLNSLTVALTVAVLCIYLLRWYIQGHVPLSNGFETMLFIALFTLIITSISCVRSIGKPHLAVLFGLIISAFSLLVSNINAMNPQITQLMPVLHSPWLSIHVSVIMVSYSLFAFLFLTSIMALIRKGERARLTVICQLMLYPAVLLLTIGIFIGAVWANVSWGSYWQWDPKETWALITMLIYCVTLHREYVPFLRSERAFLIYIIVAFLSVLFTYFGVNYLLTGMHSYA